MANQTARTGDCRDKCDLPVIAAYTNYDCIQNPASHSHEWPESLKTRIENGAARVIHIPFKKEPIAAAIEKFDPQTKPKTSLSYYSRETYAKWRISPD